MGENLFTFTSSEPSVVSRITPPILKISTPGIYTTKETNNLYDSIKTQVGNHYLPVIVPEDVTLEIIDEI